MVSAIDGATVLVVEDRILSDFLKSVLSQQGYRVICTDRSRAQALLEGREFGVDALITNIPQQFAEFRGLPVVYVASCPDPEGTAAFARACQLTKPFPPRELFHCLEQLLT
jgi:DNA-binding response OmpR family regulator